MTITETIEECKSEQQFDLTIFHDRKAYKKQGWRGTSDELAKKFLNTTAFAKDQLPMLSGCTFGNDLSPKGSLRHHANVLGVSALVADYDGEALAFSDAVRLLKDVGITGLIHTSASHTAAAPRWRVIAPLATIHEPSDYTKLMDCLNGVLGGTLASESWIVSQSYYFGFVQGSKDQDLQIVSGNYIDKRDDLDLTAKGYPICTGKRSSQKSNDQELQLGSFDAAWLERMISQIESQNLGYRNWIKTGFDFKKAGLSFDAWAAFSLKHSEFDDDIETIRAKWDSFS